MEPDHAPIRNASTPRGIAVDILVNVVTGGQTLTIAMERYLPGLANQQDRALTKEICFGTLRWLPRLEAILELLLKRPLRKKDGDIRMTLLIGLYQLLFTRVPEYAAVGETVDVVSMRNKAWAKGVVNGVLRNFQRHRERLLEEVDRHLPAATAHPDWLLQKIRSAWPEEWRELLARNNRQPEMCLRINQLRTDREAYMRMLTEEGMAAEPLPYCEAGLVMERPVGVESLPGFERGLVSVQDGAAQQAAPLLAPLPGERVLDACAAPGGKSAHLLELQPQLQELVAIDRDAARLKRVGETMRRLELHATLIFADASLVDAWWDGRLFNRILLDAPCSATGVIRRHPDIKLLRRPEDIPALVEQQRRLLTNLWPLLAPGGTLLYATCSILPAENEEVIAQCLEGLDGVFVEHLEADWGRSQGHGRQILPGEEGMDGFYYALLKKRT